MIIIILILSNYYASKMIIKLWYYYLTDVVIPTDYSLIWILNIMLLCVISMFIYACECIGLPTLWLVCTCT
jgi:hypothetical protein